MANDITCPVDFVQVNENQPRLVAAQVVLLTAIFIGTGWWPVFLLLAVDFFLRAFKLGRYSLLGQAATSVVQQWKLSGKKVDQAPKRFAAKLGFIFSLIILTLSVFHQTTIAAYVAVVLILFAILESVFNFCVGCRIYSIGIRWHIFK